MSQLVQPNLAAVGQIGYCLEYASREVFRNPAAGTTAWNAWLVAQYKHLDQNFPALSFPVWFSGAGGDGHVAVYTPKGIYSSPYNMSTGHNVLNSIAQVEQLYGVKYVGWSEDILQLRVIEGDEMFSQDMYNAVAKAFKDAGVNPPPTGLVVGTPITGALQALFNTPEWSEVIAKQKVDQTSLDTLNKMIGFPTPPPAGLVLGTDWAGAIAEYATTPEYKALPPRGGTTLNKTNVEDYIHKNLS